MSDDAPDPRVDELRQRLRALGYLDGSVDRFVLGPARERRRPAAIAILASVRIGMLAAALLGPAAAIGITARMPGLVTGFRDAVVMALYMGVLFGAATTVLAFGASLTVAALAGARVTRRARTLSILAGRVVTLASLAYLTLWWRNANAGLGWSAPVWTAFALLVAVGISILLGHAVRVTALAVMVSGEASTAEPEGTRARSSWAFSIGGGALAFAGAAALLFVSAPSATRGANTGTALTVVSTSLRVRVIAIDGLDPGVFDPLVAAGRLPALGRALTSSRGRLAADPSPDPARAWTTIATGQPPERHGVHGLETRRIAGLQGAVSGRGAPSRVSDALGAATDLLRLTRPAIASGAERREKTFWEVAADAGLRTAVVNWWATWPAPAGDNADGPVILTDRATLRLERGGELDREIAPRALFDRLQPRWRAIRAQAAERAAAALPSLTIDTDLRAILLRSAELDAMQIALAHEVSSPSLDLIAIYLPGLDIAQHALLAGVTSSPSLVAARLDALREYYVCLDRLAADLLQAEPGELVIVVTQPGRVAAGINGLIGLSGSAARPDAVGNGSQTDVMPTVLHALGVPISREIAGAPMIALMTEGFEKQHPIRSVASYGSPAAAAPVRTGQPLDQEAIDRLRSLGYVK